MFKVEAEFWSQVFSHVTRKNETNSRRFRETVREIQNSLDFRGFVEKRSGWFFLDGGDWLRWLPHKLPFGAQGLSVERMGESLSNALQEGSTREWASYQPSNIEPVQDGDLLREYQSLGGDLAGLDWTRFFAYGEDSDLRDLYLAGCDLTNNNLKDSIFEGSNLVGVNLSGTDLTGCDLTDVTMKDIVTDSWTIFPKEFASEIARDGVVRKGCGYRLA